MENFGSVPENLSLNIDLSKIKYLIFLNGKNKNISNQEMMKTFNCGVGFCLIVDKKTLKVSIFKEFIPQIGHISRISSFFTYSIWKW